MREVLKRVDPAWFRLWLACYGGSLTVLFAYLVSAIAAAAAEVFPSK
jgi:hypothetical protein